MRVTGDGATRRRVRERRAGARGAGHVERDARVARAAARARASAGSRFGEVRYRIKSWKRLDLCIDDARAAIERLGGERTLLARLLDGRRRLDRRGRRARRSRASLGLAPWIPDRLDVSTLRGKRLDVIHGALDRWLPGIPGVEPVELAPRLRARPGRRRRGHVHADPGRRARTRRARSRRRRSSAPARPPLGRARRRRARALRAPEPGRLGRRLICAAVGSLHVPDEPELLERRGSSTTTGRPASRSGRAVPRPGTRGGCCASPRRRRAARRASCCATRRGHGSPAPEHVADRVHAEGRVLVEEDADQAAPDERLDAELPVPPSRSRSRTGSRA